MRWQQAKSRCRKVRLYRPFSAQALIDAIPDSVKQISVLDRTKSWVHLASRFIWMLLQQLKGSKFDAVLILVRRYGLGSKDTTPAQIVAVFENTERKYLQSVSKMM